MRNLIMGVGVGVAAAFLAGAPANAGAVRECRLDAKGVYKECRTDCKEQFRSDKDLCRNVDHECANACRAGREGCIEPFEDAIDACKAVCKDDRAIAKARCRDQFTNEIALDICIDAAQLVAFLCKDDCRENTVVDDPGTEEFDPIHWRLGIKECRQASRTCIRACPPPTTEP